MNVFRKVVKNTREFKISILTLRVNFMVPKEERIILFKVRIKRLIKR